MSVRRDMDNLRNKLRIIELRIKEIQSSCSHRKPVVAFEQISSSNVRVIVKCKDCDRFLRYPTKDEQTKFFQS